MTDRAAAFIETLLDAVARHDHDVLEGLIAEDVVLHTPRFLKPITSRMHVMIVLRTIPKVLEGFRYGRTWAAGSEALMEFKGAIGAVQVHGLDVFHLNAEGKASELTVFIRPTKALAALAEAEDALVLAEMARLQALAGSDPG